MASRMTAKKFVGSEIRRAREDARMSRAKLAKPLNISESLVVKWEYGKQGILPEYMKRILGIDPNHPTYGQPLLEFPPEFIVRMIEALVNGETGPEFHDKWLTAEKLASMIWWFEIYLIPGLLQTPDYVRAILPDEVAVNSRLERQKVLSSDVAPSLVAIISESALRHNVGGSEVMAAQLDYLLECAMRENITISVVPTDSEVCAKFRGPFIVATLESGKDVAYTDSPISGQVAELQEDITTLRRLFDLYRSDALRAKESISIISEVAEKWKT